jgi:hypothetical protein
MAETATIDPARQEEFVGKVVEQISGTMTTLLGAVGDRLGLFKNLAQQGPVTSAELASRTKLNERYVRRLRTMGQGWARWVFMKLRCASFARKRGSAPSGVCRWKIHSTIYTKQNRNFTERARLSVT